MNFNGIWSEQPAEKWEEAMVSGNGIHGVMMYGQTSDEQVIINHERLFLPLGSNEEIPNLGQYLPKVRELIKTDGYEVASDFVLKKALEQGHRFIFTDTFHLGSILHIQQDIEGETYDYRRDENFDSGELTSSFKDDKKSYLRKVFVSRKENIIVVKIENPNSKVDCKIIGEDIKNELILSKKQVENNYITYNNEYIFGKGGFCCCVLVKNQGGSAVKKCNTIEISKADSVTIFVKIATFDDMSKKIEAQEVLSQLENINKSYDELFEQHKKLHYEIMNRVKIDLGGTDCQRNQSYEKLLEQAQTGDFPKALYEKAYSFGRYMYITCCGELPPNLQGLWTGSWKPSWSGDFTLNTNIQHELAAVFSTAFPEAITCYTNLIDSCLEKFRENARKIYGCNGILAAGRVSNTGAFLHYGYDHRKWKGLFWTCGMGWLLHWYMSYYHFTLDKYFLKKKTLPLMLENADFYIDFLFEDENGYMRFSPSYSAENGCGDNSTQDIAVCKEFFKSLFEVCEILDYKPEKMEIYKNIVAKLPPYTINSDGAIKEWLPEEIQDNYMHRHFSALYPLFESNEITRKDEKLFKACEVAIEKKREYWIDYPTSDNHDFSATHGYIHYCLCCNRVGRGDEVSRIIRRMFTDLSYYPSLVCSHHTQHIIFNVDGNGGTPKIINRCIYYSTMDSIELLPALPSDWDKGELNGVWAKGGVRFNKIKWNNSGENLETEFYAIQDNTTKLFFPCGFKIQSIDTNNCEILSQSETEVTISYKKDEQVKVCFKLNKI